MCGPVRMLPQEAGPRPQSTRFYWIVEGDTKLSATARNNAVSRSAIDPLASLDSFQHLRTLDWNTRVDLEAQCHISAMNAKHRDFQQAMKPVGSADHNRLPICP
jgi:hypothetical protein